MEQQSDSQIESCNQAINPMNLQLPQADTFSQNMMNDHDKLSEQYDGMDFYENPHIEQECQNSNSQQNVVPRSSENQILYKNNDQSKNQDQGGPIKTDQNQSSSAKLAEEAKGKNESAQSQRYRNRQMAKVHTTDDVHKNFEKLQMKENAFLSMEQNDKYIKIKCKHVQCLYGLKYTRLESDTLSPVWRLTCQRDQHTRHKEYTDEQFEKKKMTKQVEQFYDQISIIFDQNADKWMSKSPTKILKELQAYGINLIDLKLKNNKEANIVIKKKIDNMIIRLKNKHKKKKESEIKVSEKEEDVGDCRQEIDMIEFEEEKDDQKLNTTRNETPIKVEGEDGGEYLYQNMEIEQLLLRNKMLTDKPSKTNEYIEDASEEQLDLDQILKGEQQPIKQSESGNTSS